MAAGVVLELPLPSPSARVLKFTHIYLTHICFACRVVGDSDLPPIWDVMVQDRGKTEGLATLN